MELSSPVRVVVVDDNPMHLVSIANGLARAGVPCVSHWYDIESGRLAPPAPPEGYPYLRILFTDLNIREMVGASADAKSLASVLISEVLQPLIAPASGPYSICLWTSTGSMANEVSPIIIERINHESLGDQRRPAPLLVNALDKRELVPDKNEAAQEAIAAIFRQKDDEKQPKIEDLISSAISQDPQLRTALAWESRASHAAAKTINNVYRVSGFEHSTDVKESAAFQKVLAKIAIEAAGCKNAKQDPAGALDDGLADLFQDEMRSNVHSTLYQEAVNAAVPNPPLSRAPVLTDDSRIALNTTLHLERQPLTGQNIERGLVTDVNTDEALNHLGLANRGKLLQEELTYNSGLFAAAARVATKGSPELEVIQQRLEFAKEHKDELLARSKIVIIEVGADCDHAQRKDRTVRFLLGAEIPADLSTFIYGPTNRSLRSESLREFGPWEVEAGSRFHLLVSLNRFAVQQTWLRNADLLIRYRLRKPLVDQLLYWYSMHSTRPGIINIT